MLSKESNILNLILKSKELLQSFSLLQVVDIKTIMHSCCKGNDTIEDVVVGKGKPHPPRSGLRNGVQSGTWTNR